jgi:hypothetical protein
VGTVRLLTAAYTARCVSWGGGDVPRKRLDALPVPICPATLARLLYVQCTSLCHTPLTRAHIEWSRMPAHPLFCYWLRSLIEVHVHFTPVPAPRPIVAPSLTQVPALWFRWHRRLQIAGLVVSLTAAGLAVYMTMHAGKPHLGSLHAKVGLGVTVLGLAQPLNALLRPHPVPRTTGRIVRGGTTLWGLAVVVVGVPCGVWVCVRV